MDPNDYAWAHTFTEREWQLIRGALRTCETIEWAGRNLTEDELADLEEAIPNSSIPEAIGTIADNLS